MSVSRPDGRAPLRVFLAPLAAARAGAFSSSSLRRRPAVIVFVSVPENNVTPPAELLEHLWGLTPTEARLAAALVEGRTVSDFLDESGISDNTARTHLKRVFHKAGVTRQSELIRLAQTALNTSRHNESD